MGALWSVTGLGLEAPNLQMGMRLGQQKGSAMAGTQNITSELLLHSHD